MYYEQGKLQLAIDMYRQAIAHEPHFPEAYNNLGNALREAGRAEEAVQCYTLCIQLQLSRPAAPGGAAGAGGAGPGYAVQHPAAATLAQAARLSVAYNNLGGILKMQARAAGFRLLYCDSLLLKALIAGPCAVEKLDCVPKCIASICTLNYWPQGLTEGFSEHDELA